MNFFESQARVRKNTLKLVFLFTLAVLTLIILTNLLVMVVFGFLGNQPVDLTGDFLQQIDWPVFLQVGAGVVVVVAVGSLYKIMVLAGGGKQVAESLGGRLVARNSTDPNLRMLLNVVEEMAIASGTPAPPVYLLEGESGINAFAAGFSPRDAVIGVTRGTVEQLNRDQLQGVIAHEFSHIFNGDMRLNIRLIGILHGILILGIAGYYILRSSLFSRSSRRNNKNAGGIIALGVGLMVIGFTGTFFGGLIKAAVSRQREYLADASAVQFTRNPDGIAGALKRIGGLGYGSAVENPAASEVSHAFFAQGVSGFMQSLAATHPPLKDRIKRIDPHWDGKFDASQRRHSVDATASRHSADEPISREQRASGIAGVAIGASLADVAGSINRVGNPDADMIDHARELIAQIPSLVRFSAAEPYGARAVIYCTLLDSKNADVCARQLAHLRNDADPQVYRLVEQLMTEIDAMHIRYRLPLIDITIAALKQLSNRQYQVFRDNITALIKTDARVDLMEWSVQKIIFNHLDSQFYRLPKSKRDNATLAQLQSEVELLLSVMAYAGSNKQDAIIAAFAAAVDKLQLHDLKLVDQSDIGLANLDHSLQQLEQLKPMDKSRLLHACAISVLHDEVVSPVEGELLRAYADVLGCPMPPIDY